MYECRVTEMEKILNFLPKKMERVISNLGDRYLSDIGLKSYHVPVICVICCNDGVDQKSIRETVPFDKSRISVIVRELLDAGLVYDSASGRSSSLHLTQKGLETVEPIIEFKKRVTEDICCIFNEEETAMMNDIFFRLNTHLDKMLSGCPDSDPE